MAVHACNAVGLAREELRGEVAECGDQLRLDQFDLLEEVALAGLDLVGLRVAVPGRAALDPVGDVDVVPREADSAGACRGFRPTNERMAPCPARSGRLAHEHEVGGGRRRRDDPVRPQEARAYRGRFGRRPRLRRRLSASGSAAPPRGIRLRRIRRSSVARRCREQRTRKAGGASSVTRSPGSRDRRRPAARAPRSGSRTTCTRTRRSASPMQSRQLPGQSANDCGRT